jgi:hypothetical protein
MRRLGQVIGRCEATTPAPNVAEKKRTKGASPTAFFCSPSRESGEAHTDLLGEVKIAFIFFWRTSGLPHGGVVYLLNYNQKHIPYSVQYTNHGNM